MEKYFQKCRNCQNCSKNIFDESFLHYIDRRDFLGEGHTPPCGRLADRNRNRNRNTENGIKIFWKIFHKIFTFFTWTHIRQQ